MTKDDLAGALIILYDVNSKYTAELKKLSKELLEELYEGVIKNARAYNELKEKTN